MKLARQTLALCLLVPAAWGQTIDGLWDGNLKQGSTEVPFRFGLSGSGAAVKGWFFNGDDKLYSSSGSFENGTLTLKFGSYAATLKLTRTGSDFDGTWTTSRGAANSVHLTRAVDNQSASGSAPNIAGIWVIEDVRSSKGEKAWNLILTQNGSELMASILRVDGDTGALTGRFKEGQFVVSHFDGSRPALWKITPQADGSLSIDQGGRGNPLVAIRQETAIAKGLPAPTDPNEHTFVKDASKPFPFSFPDLNGAIVSNTDARFQGKVVLVNITGSWCPNCHDEAPFLAQVYDRYHDQGLEIVALSFEEAEQLPDVPRLRAFVQENGIHYPVLVGGETSSAKDKLTQAENWDAWPTTFFVGRDGKVKAVHAGFPSSGSGVLYEKEKQEFIARVESLLAAQVDIARK